MKKILFVDDEADLLKMSLLRLTKTGYEAFGAADGREVLDGVRRRMPDLIILDVYLPGMNGDTVATLLKKDETLKHIPVILISADTETLEKRSLQCGADGYLSKPFESGELIRTVQMILGPVREDAGPTSREYRRGDASQGIVPNESLGVSAP